VARLGGAEAEGGHDVARAGLLDLLALVRVHAHEAADALLPAGDRVQHGGAVRGVAGVDAEICETAHVGVGHDLEGQCAERLLVVRASLDGVSRLSQTIASRDQDLQKLFAATGKTSQILADRNKEFTQLIRDGGLLVQELNNRQQAISQLLTGTQRVSQQLTGLVRDNEAAIGPALTQLNGVIDILKANNENLDKALKLYEPFIRLYANVVGNGRWFDQVVVNLLPPGLPDIPGYRDPVRTLGGN